MKEYVGDLFTYPADALVVPINWTTKRNGEAVMGAGVAKQAAGLWAWLPMSLGTLIEQTPAIPHVVCLQAIRASSTGLFHVLNVPTKRHWRDRSDLALIEQGAERMAEMVERYPYWQVVALPRLGCGLGGLSWGDVRPILARHLDDRFVVVSPEGAR